MWKWIGGFLVTAIIAVVVYWFSIDKHVRYLTLNQPTTANPLFWDTKQRDAAFQSIEKLNIFPYRIVTRGETQHDFTIERTLPLRNEKVDSYFDSQRLASLVVLHKGKLVYERYELGFDHDEKWTSFSVAKSFTSTLVGAAIKDGYIKSLQDKVSDYIPNLKGSSYDDVTIEQLLTMTSGVQWDEDYGDPVSDVNKFNSHKPDPGIDATVSYMRKLPRAHEPGTRWQYSTGETNLIGVLVSQATGKNLSDYLSDKVWKHIGAQQDASWLLGSTGHEISGCCIQATTRDFALFGHFIANGAMVNGESILPANYLQMATTKQVEIGSDTGGYGYQWWTFNDGAFHGRGIFGQGIFIDRERDLVVAVNSNWPVASAREYLSKKVAMYRDIQQLIDTGY